MHYLLFYDVVDNYAERRVPFRTAHLAAAKAAVEAMLAKVHEGLRKTA